MTSTGTMKIRTSDLLELLSENKHLRQQRDELQARASRPRLDGEALNAVYGEASRALAVESPGRETWSTWQVIGMAARERWNTMADVLEHGAPGQSTAKLGELAATTATDATTTSMIRFSMRRPRSFNVAQPAASTS